MQTGKFQPSFTQEWIREMLAHGVEPPATLELTGLVEEELQALESRIGHAPDPKQPLPQP